MVDNTFALFFFLVSHISYSEPLLSDQTSSKIIKSWIQNNTDAMAPSCKLIENKIKCEKIHIHDFEALRIEESIPWY